MVGVILKLQRYFFCIDEFKKAIEIQIKAIDPQVGINNNEIRSIASIGGFSQFKTKNKSISTP